MTNNKCSVRWLDNRAGHYLLLILVTTALTLPNLGSPSLWDIDEGHNAEAAREMLESGNWITPTFNFQLRVDKPALLYWLQMAAYCLFGINEFAARLPSALAALGTVVLTYELGRRMFGPRTGLLAGLVLMSAPMFCGAAHFANPDALLNLCTILTFMLFWQSFPRDGWGWLVLTGVSTGLGVLAKGPVGVILPVAVIWLFLLCSRQLHRLLDWRVGLGLMVFSLVVLPWCILVGAETKGRFLKEFFWTHNLGRFRAPMEQHSGPIYYYVLVVLAGFAPWSVFLGQALWYAARGEGGDTEHRRMPRGLHPMLILGPCLGAFCGAAKGYGLGIAWYKGTGNEFAEHLPGATLGSFLLPLVGLTLGGAALGFLAACGGLGGWRAYRTRFAGESGALATGVSVSPPSLSPVANAPGSPAGCSHGLGLTTAYRFLWCWIAVYFVFFSLSGTKLPNYVLPIYPAMALLLGRFLDRWHSAVLQPPRWSIQLSLALLVVIGVGVAFGLLVAGGAVALPRVHGQRLPGMQAFAFLGLVPILGAIGVWWCLQRQERNGVIGNLTVMAVLFTWLLAADAAPAIDVFKAPRPLAQRSQANDTGREIRVGCYRYYQPSLVFYCRREVSVWKDEKEALEFLSCPLPVYLFLPTTVWEGLQTKVPGTCRAVAWHHDLYRNCDVVVVCNQ